MGTHSICFCGDTKKYLPVPDTISHLELWIPMLFQLAKIMTKLPCDIGKVEDQN